jgi:hypothetical protein
LGMNDQARAFELLYSGILFFNCYYPLLAENTSAIFLLWSVSYLNLSCFLPGTSTIETQHPSVKCAIQSLAEHPCVTSLKSATQSLAELLFNSYAENPPLLQTDIARGENRYSRKYKAVAVAFVEPLPSIEAILF